MKFDSNGLPKDSGASDWGDSCRLVGLMVAFDHQTVTPISQMMLAQYVKWVDGTLVAMRHPTEVPWNNHKNFTRDQLICLVAGMAMCDMEGTARKLLQAAEARGNRAQNTEADVEGSVKKFPNGADWLSPSHMNHLRRCSGEEPTWFGNLWLKMDIAFHALLTPNAEPNQLLCMCLIAGPEYVNLYKKLNPNWRDGIYKYWTGWRQEYELAKSMIAVINYNAGE